MKKKKFDCVEMKRKGSRKIYEETKDLTLEQEVAYWRKKSEEMARRYDQPVPLEAEQKRQLKKLLKMGPVKRLD